MKSLFAVLIFVSLDVTAQQIDIKSTIIDGAYKLPNFAAPLDYSDDLIFKTNASAYLPVKDQATTEHVRGNVTQEELEKINQLFDANSTGLEKSKYSKLLNATITAIQQRNNKIWIGTKQGLYIYDINSNKIIRNESYGLDGPLSTQISDISIDGKGTLWIGTPIGLNSLSKEGEWLSIRGSEGLPVEEITALAIDQNDRIWIGTTQGAILYTPYEEGRRWYYRAGKRYLIHDVISDIELAEDGKVVYFKTDEGISKIEAVKRTLVQKADIIENRINK